MGTSEPNNTKACHLVSHTRAERPVGGKKKANGLGGCQQESKHGCPVPLVFAASSFCLRGAPLPGDDLSRREGRPAVRGNLGLEGPSKLVQISSPAGITLRTRALLNRRMSPRQHSVTQRSPLSRGRGAERRRLGSTASWAQRVGNQPAVGSPGTSSLPPSTRPVPPRPSSAPRP